MFLKNILYLIGLMDIQQEMEYCNYTLMDN